MTSAERPTPFGAGGIPAVFEDGEDGETGRSLLEEEVVEVVEFFFKSFFKSEDLELTAEVELFL